MRSCVCFCLAHFDLLNGSERGRARNINLLLQRDWNLILVYPHPDRDSNSYRSTGVSWTRISGRILVFFFLMHVCRITESQERHG